MPDKLPGELGVAVVQEPCCRDGIRLFVALSQIWHLRRFVLWSLPVTYGAQRGRTTMAISFKGAHFPQEIILMGVRW
jgi:hypothetical protein